MLELYFAQTIFPGCIREHGNASKRKERASSGNYRLRAKIMSVAITALNQAYFLWLVPVIMCFAVVFTLFQHPGCSNVMSGAQMH